MSAPAKSPQSVMSKIRFCAWKNVSMSQPPVGQFATGVPSEDVSMDEALFLIASGTSSRE